MSNATSIPRTVTTPRLRLTAYTPDQALRITREVAACLDHLRPFMPFAQAEPDEAAYARLFATFEDRFERGDYAFSVWTHDGDFVGGCGLHPHVSAPGREVGYWVARREVGQGYAGEMVAGLCHLAFEHLEGIDRVELRIEPSNAASLRVAEKAGFAREALLRRRVFPGEPPRDVLVYTLFADEWAGSPLEEVPVRVCPSEPRRVPTSQEIALRDARRMAIVLRELAPEGQAVGAGWAACDVPGSWADFAAGLGIDGPVDDAVLDDLIAFYEARGRAARVMLTPYEHPSLWQGLSARGFVLYQQETLLVRALTDLPAPLEADGLRLRRVDPGDDTDVEAFVDVQLRAFFPSEPAPAGMAPITRRVARHPRNTSWLAELDGEIVGSAGIEVFEDLAVLVAGAVVPEARRRGIQTALIRHRLRAARMAGAAVAVVGSTPGGPTERNVLRAGFTVGTTVIGLELPAGG